MIKNYHLGFTLVELIVAALIIVSITGAIMYGIVSSNNSLRNAEIRQLAFIALSNKAEELKAQVALDQIQSPSVNDKKVCIEYKNISHMINGNDSQAGCNTMGYISHNIKKRQTESLHARIYDIKTKIKWKMVSHYGKLGKDTSLSLNMSQLVFN